jgi:hypothetical protein
MQVLWKFFVGTIIFSALQNPKSLAQSTAMPYVVLSAHQVLVNINCTAGCSNAELTDIQPQTLAQGTITPVMDGTLRDPNFVFVTFSEAVFRSKATYSLSILHSGVNGKLEQFAIDTSPNVTLIQGISSNSVVLRSTVAMTLPGSTIPIANGGPTDCPPKQFHNVGLTVQLPGLKIDFSNTQFCEIDQTTMSNNDLGGAARAISLIQGIVTSRQSVNNDTSPKPVQIHGLSNVFGDTLQLDSKTTLGQSKAPANESAAWLWVDGTITAGTGTAPAWVVEEKFAPLTTQLRGATVVTWFAVTANIGNNKVGGQTAKDVIDFVGPSLKKYQDWKRIGLEPSIAPTYETNRAFNHRNLLAVGDVIWDLGVLNRTQFVRTALSHPAAKLPKAGDYKGGYARTGWNLHFHSGIETGKALADVLVTNTKTKAVVGAIPTYPICRIVPQVDGIFQFKWISLESLFTGRYLFTTETTAVNDKNGNPYLKPVSGAKGVNVLTFGIAPASQHFALTVAYTNGFSAPTYQRANGVKVGVQLKY